ncbi:heparinase II/III family protein [Streptomyces sp. NPDC020983]|uniref:heparinase II/III domain-containing protein n=1 Tax=Streptomyces sp. NPDC020983 TaxID=3365106 RepID=UPI0037B78959
MTSPPAPDGVLSRRFASVLAPGSRLAGYPRTGRPAVPTVEDRAVWDAVDRVTRERILHDAQEELARPAPQLRASDWARTFRDGVRTAYEDRIGALYGRTALFAVAAVLRDESAPATAPPGAAPYLDAAADGLVALLEASTWCWAPHDRFTARQGEQLPDPDRPFLDLGAAEAALLLAWADHALGNRLDARLPGLRRRIRREVRQRVLGPFREVRDWHWLGLAGDAHNWNAWIHHAVLSCALLLVDDDGERAELVRLVVAGLDLYLAVLPDDGGIDEGVAYWWLGAGQLLECLDLLAAAGGPALDARDLPVLAPLVRYPRRMHLGGPWYVNVGDAPARQPGPQPWQLLHRWGLLLGAPDVAAHAVAQGRADAVDAHPAQGLGRALTGLADPRWRAARRAAPGARAGRPETVVWLPRVEVLVARETDSDAEGLVLAFKGGHNGERHNHLDVGSYTVALDGRPLVVDVGKPTYTAASFGPDRYRAWPLRSDWHNVPEPGGRGQLPGARYRAEGADVRVTGEGVRCTVDLAAAYPAGLVRSWRRTVRLVRAAGGAAGYVEVHDRAPHLPAGGALLRHVLAGEVTVDGDAGTALVAAGGRVLRMSWEPGLFTARVEHRVLDDPQLRASWGHSLTRLTLVTRGTAGGPGCDGRIRFEAVRTGPGPV